MAPSNARFCRIGCVLHHLWAYGQQAQRQIMMKYVKLRLPGPGNVDESESFGHVHHGFAGKVLPIIGFEVCRGCNGD